MEAQLLKKYRESVGMSQNQLSEKTHIAQNTLSQYENNKRMIDRVTEAHLEASLRVATIEHSLQLSNRLVSYITACIMNDDVLGAWIESIQCTTESDDILLQGGQIHLNPKELTGINIDSAGYTLTIDNLYQGFKHWLVRSKPFVDEQVVIIDKEILEIDDIGISEICQYALFNDLLCDLS